MTEKIQNYFPQYTYVPKQNQSVDLERLNAQKSKQPDSLERFKTEINRLDNVALSPFIPARRLSSLPDNINDGNYARAAGLVGLMALNLPADCGDLWAGIKQIKGELPKYDYKTYQAPFSFFRGTVLEPLVNKMGKFGVKLHEWDVPLEETKFGDLCKKIFKFDIVDDVNIGRSSPQVALDKSGKIIIDEIELFAVKVEGSALGKLIGNALLRIPRISVFVMGALEIPAIIKAVSEPEKPEDKAISGGTQLVKSGVNAASILTGIGVFGALLKSRGPVGSLVGMGLGSVVGTYASKNINSELDAFSEKFKS